MREKLARNLYWISASGRYGAKFPKWETLKPDQQDFFCEKADTLILSLLIEEIKKALLTDEELGEIIRVNHDDRPFKSESAIARDTRQAQLRKIIKKLEEK